MPEKRASVAAVICERVLKAHKFSRLTQVRSIIGQIWYTLELLDIIGVGRLFWFDKVR